MQCSDLITGTCTRMVPRKSSNNLYGVATNRVRVALVMIHLPHVLMWNNSSRILVRLTDSHSYLNFRFSMSIIYLWLIIFLIIGDVPIDSEIFLGCIKPQSFIPPGVWFNVWEWGINWSPLIFGWRTIDVITFSYGWVRLPLAYEI
jgi:hypothetical protein